ncbi:zinc finger BED domain-containing protein RICESLEEPER 1-like isoform X1, partial [Aphis craccivora]
FRINSRNIKNHVKEHASEIIKNIKLDVYKRLVSLKVDCVTRLNRSIIGVNVQYIKDDKLNIKTLGMTELSEKHTSEYLKKVLINILKKYDIDNRQVYSITCDNGRNIVKMVKIFNDGNEDDIEADIEFENTEHLRNDGQDILSESTIEDIITDTEIDLNDNNNLQQEVYSALEIENEEYLTQCLRCSVHTFQLCVEQGFKITTVNNTVVKAR